MKLLRSTSFALLLLAIVILPIFVSAQTITDENGAVVKIHRFQPAVAAEVPDPKSGAAATKPGELSESAIAQINALEQEKESRTPAQRKINSRLLYTSRMLQGKAAAPGIPVLRSGLEVDDKNNLLVEMTAHLSDDLLQQLRSAGVIIIRSDAKYRLIRALIPPAQLEVVAAYPEVIAIFPRREARTVGGSASTRPLRWPPTPGFSDRASRIRKQLKAALPQGISNGCSGVGSQVSEGYNTHQVAEACTNFGVRGAGVKIGVLSDGAEHLADSQTSGDLGPVTVLAGQTGEGDEGTAMLEIVHDLAPDATLYFATAFDGINSFADNIRALREAGCDIIVDDVIYLIESPFQDGQLPGAAELDGGVVTQAVNDVVADGAIYVSSAGNEGSLDAGFPSTWEGDFVNGGSNSHFPDGTVHKFGANAYNVMDVFIGPVFLHWADPLGGSENDYDLFVLSSSGSTVLEASTATQDGTLDPVEWVGPDDSDGGLPNLRLVVWKANSAANRFLHITAFGPFLSVGTSGAIVGHAGASGALAVGATPASEPVCGEPTICSTGPFPNPFNSTNQVEWFSADGPRRIFFEADGTAITPGNFSHTGGTTLQKPEITAADGVSVSGAGGFPDVGCAPFCLFYGTSAAAPHAAAIAGLIKSLDNTLTNSQVISFMEDTAIDIEAAGVDRDSGHGIVMALAAVEASLAPTITDLSPVSGDVGTPVTITGQNFGDTQDTSTVTFNGTAATPTTWSDTSIDVPVPAGATNGNVVVTVDGMESNGVLFTLTPNITGLSVSAAPVGTAVTITGTNFGATKGTSTVKFNGSTAAVTTWSATSIAVTVPSGATTGNVVVAINGVTSNGVAFTVEDFAFEAVLSNISVTAGQSGSEDFNITSATGFDAAITLTCTGVPDKSSCTLTPNSVPAGGTPASVHLAITTTAATTSGMSSGLFGMWLPLGGFGLVLAAGAGSGKRSRKALAALSLFLLLPLLAAIVSCGGSDHHTIPGTPKGTSTITVRAASGSTTHTSTFTLTVN